MKELLTYLVKALVRNPDEVIIGEEREKDGKTLFYKVQVNQEDMGRVIGKAGKTARAIRTVVNAAAQADQFAKIDFLEEDEIKAQGDKQR